MSTAPRAHSPSPAKASAALRLIACLLLAVGLALPAGAATVAFSSSWAPALNPAPPKAGARTGRVEATRGVRPGAGQGVRQGTGQGAGQGAGPRQRYRSMLLVPRSRAKRDTPMHLMDSARSRVRGGQASGRE